MARKNNPSARPGPHKAAGTSLLPWLGLAAILILIDQFTKVLIVGYYQLGDATRVTSFFDIVRAHNTGAAFSFLATAGGWQKLWGKQPLVLQSRGRAASMMGIARL